MTLSIQKEAQSIPAYGLLIRFLSLPCHSLSLPVAWPIHTGTSSVPLSMYAKACDRASSHEAGTEDLRVLLPHTPSCCGHGVCTMLQT